MPEILLLAIASAFWPTLIAVDVISLRAPHPAILLGSFLAGGLLTTVTVGMLAIYVLQGTSLDSSRDSVDPAVALGAGVAAVLAAWALLRRGRRRALQPRPAPAAPTAPGRLQRALERGAPVAFVAAIVLDLIPGVFPLVALKDIAELDYGVPATFAVVLAFYLVMFAFIEVPLAAYLVAPAPTASATKRFNAWLDRNAALLAIGALGAAGAYLVVRGIAGLF